VKNEWRRRCRADDDGLLLFGMRPEAFVRLLYATQQYIMMIDSMDQTIIKLNGKLL
jgi:hypothetical protein